MGARYIRFIKKEKVYDANIDALIERVKKMRALNCNPSDIGIDNYVWKRLSLNRSNVLTKFL